MFTGIVKAVGSIAKITPQGGDLRLTIRLANFPWKDFAEGESISVNGVCLTATEVLADGFIADVSRESAGVTTLGRLVEGSMVNLEPAVSLGERLGGHLVSGHVDCVGTIKSREQDARSVRLQIEIPAAFMRYVASKGSVCIDGVSLTVNEVSNNTFGVNIIPHTAEVTIIGDYRPGTEVNVEVDLIARYLERLIGGERASAITREFLRAHGYD
ncbi:MAG: riboflavin synthase [Woeseiaceae bacterium]|nr:riboflavin synthase [Woeseiaceae bacterium]